METHGIEWLVGMVIVLLLARLVYKLGHDDGRREGFARGRDYERAEMIEGKD